MVLLFWAFSMLGLLGFIAIVADTGLASMERRELQNTADAAAMAGAQDLLLTGGDAEAGAESFAAAVHDGLVGNQAVLQDFRVTSNVSANAQSLLDETGEVVEYNITIQPTPHKPHRPYAPAGFSMSHINPGMGCHFHIISSTINTVTKTYVLRSIGSGMIWVQRRLNQGRAMMKC